MLGLANKTGLLAAAAGTSVCAAGGGGAGAIIGGPYSRHSWHFIAYWPKMLRKCKHVSYFHIKTNL